MDDLAAAVAAMLQQAPAKWAPSPAESSDALRLLTQAGFVERRLTFTLQLPGQDSSQRITLEATGELGLAEALEPVLQDLWAKGKDRWQGLSQEVGTPAKPIVAAEIDEWRITDAGRLAQEDLANGEQRPIDFVLRRGFFDGQPRLLPNGQVTRRLPVRGTGRLVRVEIAQNQPLTVDIAKCSAAAEIAQAFEAMLLKLQAVPQHPAQQLASTSGVMPALLRVYTNGVSDDRVKAAAQVVAHEQLSVNDKLHKLDELLPIPPTASAMVLAEALGVSKQAILKTGWWSKNRKGEGAIKKERRRSVHRDRAARLERDTEDD